MTREEAHKKVCPFMTYCVNENQTYDAKFAVYASSACVADECMMWQWTQNDKMYGYCGRAER